MKFLSSLLFLLFTAQQPYLKIGAYKAASTVYGRFENDCGLVLNANGTFEHHYYLVRMCLGWHQEYRRGTWQQNGDTLTLIDTLYTQIDLLPYIKGFHYQDDSIYVWTARYLIMPGSKLSFLNSYLKNTPITEQWPDFVDEENYFFEHIFNYRSRHDCFVNVTAYHDNDTLEYIIENHALYKFMTHESKSNLEYAQYTIDMRERLEKREGIPVSMPLTELQRKWRFTRVINDIEIKTAASKGKEYFIDHFFDKGVLKNGINKEQQPAIISQLFNWRIATMTDDETGYLIIPERLRR